MKLFNSNLDVIDEAFEYLVNQSSKGDKGQYFTPRYVIDMCVQMLNPKEDEYTIDTASGSSGFPVHTIFHVWHQMAEDQGLSVSHLFSSEPKPPSFRDYVKKRVFAIDFDEKAVRVARTLNLIAGDGETNVLHLNTLDYERWPEITDQDEWKDIYYDGFKRLRRLRPKKSKDYREFQFDVLMANPPFAGDIKESQLISRYELAKKPDGKWKTKVGRDILFIERNLDFLKPGGRMAIVLPQGRFNNSSDKGIRDFIAERCRILAVVGLHGNTFKPHTGTKTSVLFVQKWNDDAKAGALCPRREDYNIFFATMQKSGKDNSGDKIYVKAPDDSGGLLRDDHGHLIVDHDLYNHEGKTEDGIAEAFEEFAKKEELSFFELGPSVTPFDAVKYQRLMDGLESTEMSFCAVKADNYSLRLDSDFFKRTYLTSDAVVKKKTGSILSDKVESIKSFGAYSLCNYVTYLEEGIPFLRCVNIKNSQVDFANTIYIDEKSNDLLWKSEVKPRTVLLTMSGSAGNVAFAHDNWEYPINSNQDIAKISCSENINPYYLYSFLITDYGFNQIQRQLVGSVQQHIFLWQIEKLFVPDLEKSFQLLVEKVVKAVNTTLEKSRSLYGDAEDLLLSELGLKDWQPTEETVAIKSFAESFLSSSRLDAEYYQPKFDQIVNRLTEKVKLTELDNFLVLNQRGKQPKYIEDLEKHELALPVINSKHVREGEVILTDNRYAYPSGINNPLTIQSGDVLINGTGVGTIGRCAPYLYESEALPDNHVTILRTNALDPVYLSIYLNSIVGKLQVEKHFKGSSGQIELYPNEISQFLVWDAPKPIQQEIRTKVETSHQKREQSSQLLEIAKTGVEWAIETDEESAIAWIDQQLEDIGVALD